MKLSAYAVCAYIDIILYSGKFCKDFRSIFVKYFCSDMHGNRTAVMQSIRYYIKLSQTAPAVGDRLTFQI